MECRENVKCPYYEQCSKKIDLMEKRIYDLEKSDIKRGEQYLNLEKSLLGISKSQQEIKEQQNNLINQLIQKQDSLIKLFVSKDRKETSDYFADNQDARNSDIEKLRLKLEKDKKFWETVAKILLAGISVVGLYVQLK